MTLVLPFGGEQIANSSLFSRPANNQNSSMPCVFDSEAFERDFESALIRDWTSGIGDYDMPSEDPPIKTPSESTELKRKASAVDSEESQHDSKKSRFDNYDTVPSVPSLPSDESHCSSPNSNSPSLFLESSEQSSLTSSDDAGGSAVADDDDYLPRRRGIQMWNSRQRWKDERKKVLKMSVTKLAEIEDPELCLLRSVLINNTIKKLHSDIRNDRNAKVRQKVRQKLQRMDFFTERLLTIDTSESSFSSTSDFNDEPKPNPASTSDFYDENSCDEMFNISEDFLRCSIPDRRVSSPIPSSDVNCSGNSPTTNCSSDTSSCSSAMDCVTVTTTTANVTVTTCPSCDTAAECSSPFCQRRSSSNLVQTVISSTAAAPAFPSSQPMRRNTTGGSQQCATQFRTNRDLVGGGSGDVSFPPRVPILDSVVYHSLLASLESS